MGLVRLQRRRGLRDRARGQSVVLLPLWPAGVASQGFGASSADCRDHFPELAVTGGEPVTTELPLFSVQEKGFLDGSEYATRDAVAVTGIRTGVAMLHALFVSRRICC